jgi:hypothetical protein
MKLDEDIDENQPPYVRGFDYSSTTLLLAVHAFTLRPLGRGFTDD